MPRFDEIPLEQPPLPQVNPYAPPLAEIDVALGGIDVGHRSLARPSTRFAAKMLDQLLFVGLIIAGLSLQIATRGGIFKKDFGFFLAGIAAAFGLLVYQWYLVSSTGRTLGKRWCHIRILRSNGQPVDFVTAVVMRSWLPFCLSAVPGFGSVFSLIDACFIFGVERRCLHDRIAGTIVVDAR